MWASAEARKRTFFCCVFALVALVVVVVGVVSEDEDEDVVKGERQERKEKIGVLGGEPCAGVCEMLISRRAKRISERGLREP